MKNRPVDRRIPVYYTPMQDLLRNIKTMPQAFGGYHLLLVITLQGATAHKSVELVCLVYYFFCNCARGFYYSGYAVMSCDFWGML